jgi:hypothetical protein
MTPFISLSHQQTPLIYAARQGNLEICRLLIDSKADVAARDRCFSPPRARRHLSSYTLRLRAGLAALTWAVNRRMTHVAAFLRCVGAPL